MLDKRSSMGILGNLGAFNQFQAGVSMEKEIFITNYNDIRRKNSTTLC